MTGGSTSDGDQLCGRSQPSTVRTQSDALAALTRSAERPSMRHDNRPTPRSSNKMPKIERMGGADAHAPAPRAEPGEWEMRCREERDGGERGLAAARSASSAKLMPLEPGSPGPVKISEESRRNRRLERERPAFGVAKTRRGGTSDVDRFQRIPPPRFDRSKLAGSCRLGCDRDQAASRWPAGSSSADPPDRSAKSTRAQSATVFANARMTFGKK